MYGGVVVGQAELGLWYRNWRNNSVRARSQVAFVNGVMRRYLCFLQKADWEVELMADDGK